MNSRRFSLWSFVMVVMTFLGLISGALLGCWLVSRTTPTFLTGNIDSGVAALLGALIGSGAMTIVAMIQMRNDRRQRMFDAKRICYAEALAVLGKAGVAVAEGKEYPSSKEAQDFHDKMSSLTLHAGEEVEKIRLEFHAAFPDPVPEDPSERQRKFLELKEICERLRVAMKAEVGLS